MKSLILTILYLAKDTVHRWFSRISSPLARVLVVFFLTLSALAFMGSYTISLKVVQQRIIDRGANLVGAIMTRDADIPLYIPNQREIEQLAQADSYALDSVGSASLATGSQVSLYTFSFSRLNQILPLLGPSGGPTLLQSAAPNQLPQGPSEITLRTGIRYPIYVRTLPENHPIIRLMNGRGVIVPPDMVETQSTSLARGSQHAIILSVRDLSSSESVAKAERTLHTLQRLEKAPGHVYSALSLLKELDVVVNNQVQCRIAFCTGICTIVGILLTALAGMEYRQNEYIYTLMKSFGIHPILLVGAFLAENLLLVGATFAGAVGTFMYTQRIIVTRLLNLGNHTLTLQEIMPEMQLISYSLLGCVLISSVPILVAANREIGRVLK